MAFVSLAILGPFKRPQRNLRGNLGFGSSLLVENGYLLLRRFFY